MENEQTMPGQDSGYMCGTCQGKSCGNSGGKWHNKNMWRGGGCHGGIWFVGWLFTTGFLKLTFWKGILAVVVWPFYLGAFFAR